MKEGRDRKRRVRPRAKSSFPRKAKLCAEFHVAWFVVGLGSGRDQDVEDGEESSRGGGGGRRTCSIGGFLCPSLFLACSPSLSLSFPLPLPPSLPPFLFLLLALSLPLSLQLTHSVSLAIPTKLVVVVVLKLGKGRTVVL